MSERVELLYDVAGRHGGVPRELPFVIGVLANLSGQREDLPPLQERRFVPVDRDDIAKLMGRLKTRLQFSLPALGEISLSFRQMDDFGPAQVAAQVPALGDLLDVYRRLARFPGGRDQLERILADLTQRSEDMRTIANDLNPAKTSPEGPPASPTDGASLLEQMLGGPLPGPSTGAREDDPIGRMIREAGLVGPTISRDLEADLQFWQTTLERRLGEALRAILHHPEFRRLEATWRGISYLVRHSETGEHLKIRVLNVSRDELRRDFANGGDVSQSVLFRKVVAAPYESDDGEPFGLLLGDFDVGLDDLSWLRPLARVAEAAHAPLVAAAAPVLLGVTCFTELSETEDWDAQTGREALMAWHEFREAPEARYAALTLPRVLARRPYGKEHDEVEEFAFEELAPGALAPQCLWMSAAWCYGQIVGEAFVRDGWFLRTTGVEGGGKVDGLPVFTAEVDGEPALLGPVETALIGREEYPLAQLGFVPLLAVHQRDFAAFAVVRSCQELPAEPEPADRLLDELRYQLCVCRVAHYVVTMANALVPEVAAAEQLERFLNVWLARYIAPRPEDADWRRYPLLGGRVKVQAASAGPGRFTVAIEVILPTMSEPPPTLALDLGAVPFA